MISIVPTKPLSLDDGKHTGKITHIEHRIEPYSYVDVYIGYIDGKDKDPEIKWGAPFHSSLNGKLMKMLSLFFDVQEGVEVLLEDIVNTKVEFMTLSIPSKSGKGVFSNVVDGSLKPIEKNKR